MYIIYMTQQRKFNSTGGDIMNEIGEIVIIDTSNSTIMCG